MTSDLWAMLCAHMSPVLLEASHGVPAICACLQNAGRCAACTGWVARRGVQTGCTAAYPGAHHLLLRTLLEHAGCTANPFVTPSLSCGPLSSFVPPSLSCGPAPPSFTCMQRRRLRQRPEAAADLGVLPVQRHRPLPALPRAGRQRGGLQAAEHAWRKRCAG